VTAGEKEENQKRNKDSGEFAKWNKYHQSARNRQRSRGIYLSQSVYKQHLFSVFCLLT